MFRVEESGELINPSQARAKFNLAAVIDKHDIDHAIPLE